MAGLLSRPSILFHIVHATFWLGLLVDLGGPKDIPEFKAEILREIGHEVAGPKPGKNIPGIACTTR